MSKFLVALVLLVCLSNFRIGIPATVGLRQHVLRRQDRAKESMKMDAGTFDKLEKIAAMHGLSAEPPDPPEAAEMSGEGEAEASGTGSKPLPTSDAPSTMKNSNQEAVVKLLQGLSVERVQMVPYGKEVPQEPGVKYIVASGQQECIQCEALVAAAHFVGQAFDGICNFLGHGQTAVNGKMCAAQVHVLQSCPEFVNDWCYQDFGGSQMLRSPCPPYLICHYCLGLNPLHCQRNYMFPMPNNL